MMESQSMTALICTPETSPWLCNLVMLNTQGVGGKQGGRDTHFSVTRSPKGTPVEREMGGGAERAQASGQTGDTSSSPPLCLVPCLSTGLETLAFN